MRYKEFEAPKYWPLMIFLVFLMILLPFSWVAELTEREAINAIIAQEMVDSGQFTNPTVFGKEHFSFMLSPWVLAILAKFHALNEFTIRLMSIIPLALLALVCTMISRKLINANAGAVTAAAVISSVVVFTKGQVGEPDMLFATLLCTCWLLWYYLGRIQKRWQMAWIICHLLMLVAILAGGLKAIFMFYFPLFFLTKPVRIWRRFMQKEHWISLALTTVFIIIIVLMVPSIRNELVSLFTINFETNPEGRNYFFRLFIYPIIALVGFMPWTFLAWPTFCQAFRPLEKLPVFSNYLRTIVSSTFIFFWLIPVENLSILLPLIGPMSILIGINYDLLVRRYGRELLIIPKVAAAACLSLFVVCLVASIFEEFRWQFLKLPYPIQLGAIVMIFTAGYFSFLIVRNKIQQPVWYKVLIAVFVIKLSYSAIYQSYDFHKHNTLRKISRQLAKTIPKDVTLYTMIDTEKAFPVKCFYLGHRVKQITSIDDLPAVDHTVYLIGEQKPPVMPLRHWEPISETYLLDSKTLKKLEEDSKAGNITAKEYDLIMESLVIYFTDPEKNKNPFKRVLKKMGNNFHIGLNDLINMDDEKLKLSINAFYKSHDKESIQATLENLLEEDGKTFEKFRTFLVETHEKTKPITIKIWKGVLVERLYQWTVGSISSQGIRHTGSVKTWFDTSGEEDKFLIQENYRSRPSYGKIQGEEYIRFLNDDFLQTSPSDIIQQFSGEYTLFMRIKKIHNVRGEDEQTLINIVGRDGKVNILKVSYNKKSELTISTNNMSEKIEDRINCQLDNSTIYISKKDSKLIVKLNNTVIHEKNIDNLTFPNKQYKIIIGSQLIENKYANYLSADLQEIRLYNRYLEFDRVMEVHNQLEKDFNTK